MRVSNYGDLHTTLKTNLGITASVELCRIKLKNIRQGFERVQVYSQHFRSPYNELTYALQSEHSIGKERRIALKIEEKEAV